MSGCEESVKDKLQDRLIGGVVATGVRRTPTISARRRFDVSDSGPLDTGFLRESYGFGLAFRRDGGVYLMHAAGLLPTDEAI